MALVQVRTDDETRVAFAEATHRENTTPSDALREFMRQYVRESFLREAARQSRLIAEADRESGDLDLILEVQGFTRD